MGFLDLFRKKLPPSEQTLDAGTLGVLNWSAAEEAWSGNFRSIEFCIFPGNSSEFPSQSLLAYAESILIDQTWLLSAITAEKEKYLLKHPEYRGELQNLPISALAFSSHPKKGLYLNCQLGFGAPDRFWSLDFHGHQCSGIGFDS